MNKLEEMNSLVEIIVEHDIEIIIEKSNDFGKDIGDSFVRLAEKLDTPGQKRDCYGVIQKNSEGMHYYAGFTMISEGEGAQKMLPSMTISRGTYCSILISNWNQKLMQIGPTFDQILKSGKVDTTSPCIEFYKTETELICMVRKK